MTEKIYKFLNLHSLSTENFLDSWQSRYLKFLTKEFLIRKCVLCIIVVKLLSDDILSCKFQIESDVQSFYILMSLQSVDSKVMNSHTI